jgi:hypothetical protein
MAETETGFRWWMRYVIVPMIGGGGVIAIIVAFIGRPAPRAPNLARDTPTTQADIGSQTKQESPTISNIPAANNATVPPRVSSENKEPNPSVSESLGVHKVPPREPAIFSKDDSAVDAPRTDPRYVKFYIYDKDTDLPLKGDLVELPADADFALRWDATSIQSDGPVTVEWRDRPTARLERVPFTQEQGFKGSRDKYSCRHAGIVHLDMTQELPDGTTRELAHVDVKCLP